MLICSSTGERRKKRYLEAGPFLPPCDPIWPSLCAQTVLSLSPGQQPWPSGRCQSQHGNDIIPAGRQCQAEPGGTVTSQRSLGHPGQSVLAMQVPPGTAGPCPLPVCTGVCPCAGVRGEHRQRGQELQAAGLSSNVWQGSQHTLCDNCWEGAHGPPLCLV